MWDFIYEKNHFKSYMITYVRTRAECTSVIFRKQVLEYFEDLLHLCHLVVITLI
jgi:hypothetical protein